MFSFWKERHGDQVKRVIASIRKWVFSLKDKRFWRELKKGGELSSKTMLFIVWTAHKRLRLHFDLPLMGQNQSLDDHLHKFLLKFFGFITDNQELAEKDEDYLQWLQQDHQANDDREIYYRLSHRLHLFSEDKRAEIAAAYKDLFGRELRPLEYSEIKRIHRAYKKRYRYADREFRQSKAPLIELDLRSLSLLFPWLSICFVLGGYGYTSIVYRHWGVPVHQFFLISDYFTVSLEQFQHIIVGIASYAFGVIHERWRAYTMAEREYAESAEMERRPRRFAFWVCATGLVMHIAAHIAARMEWLDIPEIILPPLGVALFVVIVFQGGIYWIAGRYFKQDTLVACTILFLVAFSASLYTSARFRIMEIEEGFTGQSFNIVTDYKEYSDNNSTFIGSNSRYIFLKAEANDAEIIRLDQIKRISFAVD